MADAALFITPAYLKETTVLDGNVDEKYLKVTIEDVQTMRIVPILGTGLFNEISSQILAGTLTPATVSNNATLLKNYIQPALKYWVMVEMPDVMNTKYTNKAVVNKNSDNSQPIDQTEVIRQMDKFKDKAEFFSQRLTNYLFANTDLFPLFTNPGSAYDTIHPKANNYNTGWAMDADVNTYGLDIDHGRNEHC